MPGVAKKLAAAVPSWGAKVAYGESMTIGGRELVPAALVIFGFGGGEGSGTRPGSEAASGSRGEGSGGGGGGYVLPIGAYIEGPNGVSFRPNPIAAMVVIVPLLSAAGWAIARVITAARSPR